MYRYKVLFILLVLFLCSVTEAHRPVLSERKSISPLDAILICAPSISQVIYRELIKETSQVWLNFDVIRNKSRNALV